MPGVAKGPMSVSGSIGSPIFSASYFSISFFSNESAIASATINLFAAIQDCPLLSIRAVTAVVTAASKSALGMTMNGSLPPNSSTVFLICFPAAAAKLAPASSLPVRVAALTRSSAIKAATSDAPTNKV